MPAKVRKALSHALYELWHGPSGEGMGFVKAAKIVNDWWGENMGSDLVIDDAGNVSTKHEWDRFVSKAVKETFKEAKKLAIEEGLDDEEARHTEYGYVTEADYTASQTADFEEQSLNEDATIYDARDVRHVVLGSEWP
jgi:hypothetical protein